jgi:hypothetical protein
LLRQSHKTLRRTASNVNRENGERLKLRTNACDHTGNKNHDLESEALKKAELTEIILKINDLRGFPPSLKPQRGKSAFGKAPAKPAMEQNGDKKGQKDKNGRALSRVHWRHARQIVMGAHGSRAASHFANFQRTGA